MPRRSTIFVSAFIIGLSGAMMPGPLLTACIGYSLERGFLAGGPLLILGHAILEFALLLLVLAGLGPLLSRRSVGAAIGLVGGGMLLWMGYGMGRFALRDGPKLALEGGTALWASPVVAGIVISLANPYWSLWWATIGLKYISLSREAGRQGVAAFFTGHTLSDVAWYLFIAGAVSLGRRAISDTVYRWIIGVCGIVLVGFGVFFIFNAVRSLRRRQSLVPEEPEAAAAGP